MSEQTDEEQSWDEEGGGIPPEATAEAKPKKVRASIRRPTAVVGLSSLCTRADE